ncbi:MAG: ferredoxin family protein [Lachnospiraceae bacterium]|nr:ferredoxin family protein [Lachnospiraceae bacterium]
MGKVTFNQDICKGCGLCILACPLHLLALDKNTINRKGYSPAYIAEPEKCIGCASCAMMCPDSVITVER